MKNRKNIFIILSFLFLSLVLISPFLKVNLSIEDSEFIYNENINERIPKTSFVGEVYEIRIINPRDSKENRSDQFNYNWIRYAEVISTLYDYTVNISINVAIGVYSTPNITIYKSRLSYPFNPIEPYEYIEMEGFWLIAGWNNWNFTFDPINLENGLYGVSFWIDSIPKTNPIESNTTWVYFINNPPNVEIMNPLSSSIVKSNDNLTIKCNVTNEEAINSVEWDITDTIDVYDWKPMAYNISSEFYESEFNMTDYHYGNYYLAINSTDDKNSSVTLKPLSFVRPSSSTTVVGDDDDSDDDEIDNPIQDFFDEVWWAKYVLGGIISATVGIMIKITYSHYRKKAGKKKSEF